MIICNNNSTIKITTNKPELNDFYEYDFKTNNEGFPIECISNKNIFYVTLIPNVIALQLVKITDRLEKMKFAVELIESKFNSEIKPINILTNKNLYHIFPLIFMVVILLVLFRDKIKLLMRYFLSEVPVFEACDGRKVE